MIKLISYGIELKKSNPKIDTLDLLAKVENPEMRKEALGAVQLLHIYKVNIVGNGCSESMGRQTNIICHGVRAGMGN